MSLSVFSPSAGADYVEERLTLTFPAGETTDVVEIEIIDDIIVEGDEYFLIHMTTEDAGVTIATAYANVTLIEDDSKWKH